ncbi:MAG: TMEM43 family protein [Planctomycetaceae bacterium]|nr:TMEM43 family protein [Planctomycetaceae bacterium]
MADSFTETTTTSWGSRIMNSIKGVLFGFVLMIAAAVVMFWNEGRTINTAKTLEEGAAAVVTVPSETVNAANEGKLVHMTGKAATDEMLTDSVFGVSAKACRLKREVQMYQWQEHSKTETRKKLGGGEEKTRTYTHDRAWVSHLVDSESFKHPDGHANPSAMPFEDFAADASAVTVGGFALTGEQVRQMSNFTVLPVTRETLARLGDDLRPRIRLDGAMLYVQAALPAAATSAPATMPAAAPVAVGDARIAFKAVQPGEISLVAKQAGSTFQPYVAKTGSKILLLTAGSHSAAEMFQSKMDSNTLMAWLLRLGGVVAMTIGAALILAPLKTVADVVPMLGSLVAMGTGIVAIAVALPLSLLVIAIGWLVYRPVIGILLLAGGVAIFVLLKKMAGKKKQAATVAA